MNSANSEDPFKLLGVARDAGEAEIRARYLELVKQFPPEREPDKFRALRAAFEAVKDPLLIARRLLKPPGEGIPQWAEAIAEQRQIPPRLTPSFLLSLGNRAADEALPSASDSASPISVDIPSDSPSAPPDDLNPHE